MAPEKKAPVRMPCREDAVDEIGLVFEDGVKENADLYVGYHRAENGDNAVFSSHARLAELSTVRTTWPCNPCSVAREATNSRSSDPPKRATVADREGNAADRSAKEPGQLESYSRMPYSLILY